MPEKPLSALIDEAIAMEEFHRERLLYWKGIRHQLEQLIPDDYNYLRQQINDLLGDDENNGHNHLP